jgi:hypothetical protein
MELPQELDARSEDTEAARPSSGTGSGLETVSLCGFGACDGRPPSVHGVHPGARPRAGSCRLADVEGVDSDRLGENRLIDGIANHLVARDRQAGPSTATGRNVSRPNSKCGGICAHLLIDRLLDRSSVSRDVVIPVDWRRRTRRDQGAHGAARVFHSRTRARTRVFDRGDGPADLRLSTATTTSGR